jgi:CCR4-NOT transcription complex subunit 6
LFWDPQYPLVKLEQAKWYLSRGRDLACKTAADAIILTGDFNSLPDSDVVREMLQSEVVGPRLFSAYQDYKEGQHPAFTNFTYKFVGCLDYIFHSGNLVPRELLQTPEDSECRVETALPNSTHGSDHVPLGALLELV